VDVDLLRERHPHFLLLGHYDKMVMPLGEEKMRAEFERLLPAMKKGGFIPRWIIKRRPACRWKTIVFTCGC
jgi:hypothetical protein